MRWAWALLLLTARVTGGRAETRVVIEDFATTTGLWTDTGEVLGLPESIQPSVGTIQLTTTEDETLRVDYDVAFTALWGPVTLGRTLNGTTYDQCANATHVSLKYKVKEPQSRPHLGTLMFCLLDGSDCSGPVCAQDKGQALELWMSFEAVALDDASAEWRELRLGLCGRSGTTRTPFFNTDGLYANGNACGYTTLHLRLAHVSQAGLVPRRDHELLGEERHGVYVQKDKMFPRTFRYKFKDAEGVARSEETVLFGDTIKAVEVAVEMSEVSESDPLWKKALPDMAPATNNSTHAHHLQVAALKSSLSAVDSGSSRTMRLRRSLSTVVRSNPSSPRQKPFQTHSSLASANGRPRNLASSSSFWANPPRAQQRPTLSRENTWRTSAPRLAHEDSKEDLNV
ncbi:unnamed protein product [Pelagomonas calceolata]|uniref:NADH:ubiquinone oxidoreductase intermediate-associated protein 30 domain-containing protein n=1 Tax=Pelagomonas calceolata TaxID=35677 RepID=A0A8J2WSU0_9STRA|nr:unnamed protein product [Pelagomonas calceolata]